VEEYSASPTKRGGLSLYSAKKSEKISYKHIKDTFISPESDDESDIDGLEG